MKLDNLLSRQNPRPFFGTAPLKCNENPIFFKLPKVKGPFFHEKFPFCYVMFGGCLYFLNVTLDKVCSNQLRSCNPTNREKYITLFFNPQHLVCRNPGFPHHLGHNLNKLTLI